MIPQGKRVLRFVLPAVLLIATASLAAGALAPFLRSTKNFVPFAGDPRVRYEPGAETAAAVVARALPVAIATIEQGQFRPFRKPVVVHVCASTASFDRYGYGVTGNGGFVFNGRLFISPKPQNTADRLPRLLTHELSHLHLEQHLGVIRFAGDLPSWFKEGLAVHLSGSGDETVPETEGRDAVARGQLFPPVAAGSLFFWRTENREGLKPHLFYRESAMFVAYLERRDPAAFEKLLRGIASRQHFGPALFSAYGQDAAELQAAFTAEIKQAQPRRLNAPEVPK